MVENNSNGGFRKQMKPYLDGYKGKLIEEFEKRRIIDVKNVKNLANTSSGGESDIDATPNGLFNDLFHFSNIVRAVYSNLDYYDSTATPSLKLMEIISRLDKVKAFSAHWKNNEDVMDIMNKMYSLQTDDPGRLQKIQKILDDNEINLNLLIPQLLEFYGTQKAISYFGNFNFSIIEKERILLNEFDMQMEPQNRNYYPVLLFDFKYLRNAILPTRNSLLKSFNSFSLYNANQIESYFYFIVVFTDKESTEFEKLKFEFKQIIKEIPEYVMYVDRIKFLPIAIGSLQTINEGFKEFKDSFIENEFNNTIFRAQTPPKNRPERNDNFYDRTFKLKETDFKITIRPTNTPFWRFGFRYSDVDDFPAITEARHNDKRTDVIHLNVGDMVNGKWQGGHEVMLSYYKHEKLINMWQIFNNYSGGLITFTVESNSNGSEVYFEFIRQNDILRIPFDLSKFNFCQLAAWSDYNNNFILATDIKVIHKGGGRLGLYKR